MSCVQVRSKFGARALRYGQELMEFSGTIPFEAFRDIGHDRYRSTLNLAGQADVLCKGTFSCHCVNSLSHDSCLLPSDQVLKSCNLLHLTQYLALRTQHITSLPHGSPQCRRSGSYRTPGGNRPRAEPGRVALDRGTCGSRRADTRTRRWYPARPSFRSRAAI